MSYSNLAATRDNQKQSEKVKQDLNNSTSHNKQNMEFLHSQIARNHQLQSVQNSASKREDLTSFSNYQRAQFVSGDNSDSSSTGRHRDQEQLMTEQDFDGHEHEEENIYDDDQQSLSDEYEGNIPNSSRSISHEKASRIQREEDIQDEDDDLEEECKNKDLLQQVESPVTTLKSSQELKTNEKNVVIERSEKFIIFKMVPQINKKEENIVNSQPTPSLSQKANISSKTYRETVEDNEDQSQSEEETHEQVLGQNEESGFCEEESIIEQSQIKIIQNKLISSSVQTYQQQSIVKPPKIIKEGSQQITPNLSRVIQINRASSLQQHQIKKDQFDEDGINDERVSFLNRQSSGGFQKLKKLEKKSILDEGVEGGEMTLTINFQNQIGQQEHERNTEVQIIGRRQSESAVQRKSTLTEVVQQKVLPNKENERKTKLKIKANDALKKELMMLEEELSKLKKGKGSQQIKDKVEKQQYIEKPAVSNEQILKQTKDLKEKRNFFVGEGQLNNQDGSFLSMDNESNDSLPHFKRKSITPASISKQKLQQRGNNQKKETAKAEEGKKKMGELSSRMNEQQIKKQNNKQSQRLSPHKNKHIVNTRQTSKHNRSRSRKKNTSLSYSSEGQMSESDDKKHKKGRKHKQNKSKHFHHRKYSQHHRKQSSSEEDFQSSSEEESEQDSSYSEEEESYYTSDENSESELDDISDSSDHMRHKHHHHSSKHYRKIQKNTEGNTYHMHYKCNRHEGKQGKRFRIKIQANEQVAIVSKHLELDFSVKDCSSHKKKCLCTGDRFLCIQVFYQVQEIMNILQYFAKSLTLFELVKMQSDKMKFALNCGKDLKSMYAIYNNQSQYVICLSQNLDCISTLAGYKMQTAASGFLMQQPFQQQPMTIPVNLMISPQQQMHSNMFMQPQIQQQNPLFIQQQQIPQNKDQVFYGNNNTIQQNSSAIVSKNENQYVTEIPQQSRPLQRNLSSHSLNTLAIQQQRTHHQGIQQQYHQERGQADKSPYRELNQRQNDEQNSRGYLNHLKNRFLAASSSQNNDEDQINSRNQVHSSYQSQNKEDNHHRPLFSYDQNDKYYPQKNHLRSGSLMDYKLEQKHIHQNKQQRQNYDDDSYNSKPQKQSPDFQKDFRNRQEYNSPEEKDSCDDASMDEGVQASAARESTLRSPKTGKQFQGMLLKHNNNMSYRSPQNQSNKKQFQHGFENSTAVVQLNIEAKKKESQAIIIGFSEGTGINPFAKKPVLKGRTPISNNNSNNLVFPSKKQEKEKERESVINRSMSVRTQALQNKIVKKQDDGMNQMKSPTNIDQQKRSSFKPGESPLKKAVIDIKYKENIDKGSKLEGKPTALDPKLKVLEHDPSDPMHNKGLMIEIFDKKPILKGQQKEISLAEMFNAKKKDIGSKPEVRKAQDVALDQDSIAQEQEDKKPKSKQELAQLRKQMMKSKVKVKQNNFVSDGQDVTDLADGQKSKKSNKDPPQNLMQRLAMGQKPAIDQKEMKKLTTRNYSNLPEIKKKKEEEKKREEQQARKNAALDFVKKQNEKRKAMLKKKKSIVEDE